MTRYQKFHWFMLGLCAWPVAGLLVFEALAHDALTHDALTQNFGPTFVLAGGKTTTDPKSWDMHAIQVDADGYVICSDQRKP